MKLCSCGTTYPNFIMKCLHCSNDLGVPPSISAKPVFIRLESEYPRISDRHILDRKVDAIHVKMREDARRECELFYSLYHGDVSVRFPQEKFVAYLKQHMHDDISIEQVEQRGRDLVALLHSVGGLGQAFKDAQEKKKEEDERKRMEEERRQEEVERRREEAKAREWEREEALRAAAAVPELTEIEARLKELLKLGLPPDAVAAQLMGELSNRKSVEPLRPSRAYTTEDLRG